MSGVHGRKNQAKPLILLGAPYRNRTRVPAVKGKARHVVLTDEGAEFFSSVVGEDHLTGIERILERVDSDELREAAQEALSEFWDAVQAQRLSQVPEEAIARW